MKQPYEAPKIVDEQVCEAQAMACEKLPGLAPPSFCGPVFIGIVDYNEGCALSPDSRSS